MNSAIPEVLIHLGLRVEDGNTGRLKVADVSGDHSQSMFQGCRCYQQVSAAVAQGRRPGPTDEP